MPRMHKARTALMKRMGRQFAPECKKLQPVTKPTWGNLPLAETVLAAVPVDAGFVPAWINDDQLAQDHLIRREMDVAALRTLAEIGDMPDVVTPPQSTRAYLMAEA